MNRPAKVSTSRVFQLFVKLGLTSFGGPIVHLSCFRDALVTRRNWFDYCGSADLVAFCRLPPGPASSQGGFASGLQRSYLHVPGIDVTSMLESLQAPRHAPGDRVVLNGWDVGKRY